MDIVKNFRKRSFILIRKFEGLTANGLIEILKNCPRDTKV